MPSLKAAVLVISDSVSAGIKEDLTGPIITDRLRVLGLTLSDYQVISDDQSTIEETLCAYADEHRLDLVITTGGTGLGPRDNTPEATACILQKEIPGITETLRNHGQARIPYAMLSRGLAGIRGNTLIINLPGSRNGVSESMGALFPYALHVFKVLRGEGHPSEQRILQAQGAGSE